MITQEGPLFKTKPPAQLFSARISLCLAPGTACSPAERGSHLGAPRTPVERPGGIEPQGSRGCPGLPSSGHPALPTEPLQTRVQGPLGYARHGRLSVKAPLKGQAAGGDCRTGCITISRPQDQGTGWQLDPALRGLPPGAQSRRHKGCGLTPDDSPPSLGHLLPTGLGKA